MPFGSASPVTYAHQLSRAISPVYEQPVHLTAEQGVEPVGSVDEVEVGRQPPVQHADAGVEDAPALLLVPVGQLAHVLISGATADDLVQRGKPLPATPARE